MSDSTSLDFSDLTVAEKIELVEDLWDSVAAETDALALTDEQKAVLDHRLALLKAGELPLVSWESVRERLFSR